MSSNSELTKECIYCAHTIPKKAKRCEACSAFQVWRRFFGGPPNVLMIVTLVGILTSLGLNWLQIRELTTKAAATREEVKAAHQDVDVAELRERWQIAESVYSDELASYSKSIRKQTVRLFV